MKKAVKIAFISTFLIIFFAFMLKWFLNGQNFIWVTSNEINLFLNSIENPINELLVQFKSIGVSNNFLDTIFNTVKTIALATILPFRLGGIIILWFFS